MKEIKELEAKRADLDKQIDVYLRSLAWWSKVKHAIILITEKNDYK